MSSKAGPRSNADSGTLPPSSFETPRSPPVNGMPSWSREAYDGGYVPITSWGGDGIATPFLLPRAHSLDRDFDSDNESADDTIVSSSSQGQCVSDARKDLASLDEGEVAVANLPCVGRFAICDSILSAFTVSSDSPRGHPLRHQEHLT